MIKHGKLHYKLKKKKKELHIAEPLHNTRHEEDLMSADVKFVNGVTVMCFFCCTLFLIKN